MTSHDPNLPLVQLQVRKKNEAVCPSHKNTPSEPKSTERPRYWRSISELKGKERFDQYLHREFPENASELPEGVSRRRWMQLMGASFAMAGVAGCRYPEESIAPFVIRPEGRIPGEDYFRATNFQLAGRVYNLLVRCVDGRPLKIEPNTEHPSGGGTDAYSQAAVLNLYDPDRSRGDEGFLRHRRDGGTRRYEVDWSEFDPDGVAMVKAAEGKNGGGSFAVLMEPTASPSTVRLLGELKKRVPNATFARHDSVQGNAMHQATAATLGSAASQTLDLSKAKVIVAIQADILGSDPGFVNNAKTFAENRNALSDSMSRLYVVEGGFSATGAAADARLALRPSQMPAFISELGRRVAAGGKAPEKQEKPFDEVEVSEGEYKSVPATERLERYLDVLAADIAAAGGDAVVIVGEPLGAEAISAGIQMNKKLGSFGKLQKFTPTVDSALGETASLGDLTDKINNGDIDSLLIIGGNPVYTATGDIDFATALAKVKNSVYLSEYDDETGAICKWSIPAAHPLESWGDVIDGNGNYGVCQPQILPLLGGRSVPEVIAVMLGADETTGDVITRRTADAIAKKSLADREWRKLLHDGFLEGIGDDAGKLSAGGDAKELSGDAPVALESDGIDQNDFEVIFAAADGLYDGRFANNGWLQEMPQTLTKIVWDNAAIMSPASAKALGVCHGQNVALRTAGKKILLPVYEMPGCAPGVVTVTMGYGRTNVGNVGGNPAKDVPIVGVDVSPIRTADASLVAYKVEARPNYTEYDIATTQDHWAIDDGGKAETESRSFNLVREGTLELLNKVPEFAMGAPKEPHIPAVGKKIGDRKDTMQSPFTEPVSDLEDTPDDWKEANLPQWGMAIDLSKCIGCSACVVACQSENNVPIVGREQVLNSREMHWLRIDRYFQGDEENADIVQQPVACMHCETAPCEQVCPVAATVHTQEGINAMAYNRCIGTRYCANNCPFKVRRFNYFNYNADVGTGYGINSFPGNIESANRKLQALVLNPEVTVRGRGVMEKCTYCIQRVEKAKINARKDGGRKIVDGDVITACQAACPSKAIEFGNLRDENSAVAKAHADVRSYGMLNQLNVKARTEYLARIRNTPKGLWTRAQMSDLGLLDPRVASKAPHHPGHDDHGHGGGHGDEAHGAHGDEADGAHEGEAHGAHEGEKKAAH